MKLGIFISGTDTGVGKTGVSSLLISSLKAYGIRTGYFKPIQTGLDSDTETVSRLTGVSQQQFPQPTYQFAKPLAPSQAAQEEGKWIQLDAVLQHWNSLEERAWVVEGAGGLLVPLNSKQTMRDLIQAMGLRLVLVASTRLGTINHTLLSLEAAKSAGISTAGIVLVGDENPGLESTLLEHSETPVIVRIPLFESISPSVVQENGVTYFPAPTLRSLYG